MKHSTMTKTRQRTRSKAQDQSRLGVAGGIMGVASVATASVGLWAAACLVSAMVQSGPAALVKGWFTAVGIL